MCYNSILSSVNYVFDWCYSPGRALGREFYSAETPNEKEKKTFPAYGTTTDALLPEDSTPVEMQIMNREHAEEPQNNLESIEIQGQTVSILPNDEEHGFTKVGDEYAGFYKVQAAGDVNEDEGDFVIG